MAVSIQHGQVCLAGQESVKAIRLENSRTPTEEFGWASDVSPLELRGKNRLIDPWRGHHGSIKWCTRGIDPLAGPGLQYDLFASDEARSAAGSMSEKA